MTFEELKAGFREDLITDLINHYLDDRDDCVVGSDSTARAMYTLVKDYCERWECEDSDHYKNWKKRF